MTSTVYQLNNNHSVLDSPPILFPLQFAQWVFLLTITPTFVIIKCQRFINWKIPFTFMFCIVSLSLNEPCRSVALLDIILPINYRYEKITWELISNTICVCVKWEYNLFSYIAMILNREFNQSNEIKFRAVEGVQRNGSVEIIFVIVVEGLYW